MVADKYRLQRLLGVGSVGAVYAAVHRFTGRHVALKLLGTEVASIEGFATRFLREARAASAIGHPAICDVLDAGRDQDGSLYLCLELLEGKDLGEAIEGQELRLDEIVEVGLQLLDGLAAAHARGIVHRDVKPENVFLTWDERGELHVKILDFGIAKDTKEGPGLSATQQGAVLGTPYYMSPEQADGAPVDARADLWSVGAVLYHALADRPPYVAATYGRLVAKILHEDPPPLDELRPDLPPWLIRVIARALVRDRDERWASAQRMASALRRRGGPEPTGVEGLPVAGAPADLTVKMEPLFEERPDDPTLGRGTPVSVPVEVDVVPTFDAHALRDLEEEPTPPRARSGERALATEPARGIDPRLALWLGVLLGALVTALVAVVVVVALYLGTGTSPAPAPPAPAPSAGD